MLGSYIIVFVLAAIYAAFLILISTSLNSWRLSAAAMVAVCCLFVLTILSPAISLGNPKPVRFETRNVPEAQILWSGSTSSDVYLLLVWPGLKEPMYYSMPLTPEMAKALGKAKQQSAATHRPLMVRNPFGGGLQEVGEDGEGEDGDQGEGGSRGARRARRPGQGGSDTGDNTDGANKFYSAPPEPLPEKYRPDDNSNQQQSSE